MQVGGDRVEEYGERVEQHAVADGLGGRERGDQPALSPTAEVAAPGRGGDRDPGGQLEDQPGAGCGLRIPCRLPSLVTSVLTTTSRAKASDGTANTATDHLFATTDIQLLDNGQTPAAAQAQVASITLSTNSAAHIFAIAIH